MKLTNRVSLDHLVALRLISPATYPSMIPYDPSESYPEVSIKGLNKENGIFGTVRELLRSLNMDGAHMDSLAWNPFADFIRPGMTVFIKPNTVVHEHSQGKDIYGVITHASIIRPILDYVCKALQGKGRIIIGDSQLYMSNFAEAMRVSGITELLQWYRNITEVPIECFDLRMNHGRRTYLYGRWAREKVEQDPRGYRFVDLAERSCFKGIDPAKLRIAIASYKHMREHHTEVKHEYLFPQSVLDSDVVISIAKLKTHRRTAITLALKNFMGIPALKDALPHFMVGSPSEGGDQYVHPSARKRICTFLHDQIQSNPFIPMKFACAITKRLVWNTSRIIPFKDDVYEAMWPGNDTLWRTLHDLNRAITYADRKGNIQTTKQRTIFSIIDGIVGGEGDGPLEIDPVYSGAMLAGFNCASVDAVAATMMGFDVNKIPLIRNAFAMQESDLSLTNHKIEDIRIIENSENYDIEELKTRHNLKYAAHPNWAGQVEYWKDNASGEASHPRTATMHSRRTRIRHELPTDEC
jgi:uncharacterized protein (DUF362 family)